MNAHLQRLIGVSLIAFLVFAGGLGMSQAQESSVSGVYLLIEVNGEKLPAVSWSTSSNGERCKTETLGGALLLDLAGRSASFVTEREVCVLANGSENVGREASTMFTGSYRISGDQLTIEDEVSSDTAALKGGLLIVKVAGVGVYVGQTTEFVLQ